MNYEEVIAKKDAEIAYLKAEIAQLRKLVFGSKRERFVKHPQDVRQLSLFGEEDFSVAAEEPEEKKETITYDRRKPSKPHPGRNEIPTHFPVEKIEIEPDVDTKGMVRVGEEITRIVKYTPSAFVILEIIRPKYAPEGKEGSFVIGELPPRALPKSIASESLLTYLLVRKFVEHMPFYRQIQSLKREHNWELPSSTLNDWFASVCTLLEPLYDLLKRKVLESGYVQADESPIKVQDSDKKGSTHQGYMWVYHNPEKGLVYFNYRKGRGEYGPKEVLESYTGLLQCDGYTVYDKIGARPGVTLAGCMAHLRRHYYKARESDKERSEYALGLFKKIYEAEAKVKDFIPEQRKEQRELHILPVITEFKQWVDEQSYHVLPQSPVGKAMKYTHLQWPKLMKIFEDGRFELDNNLIENKIRPLALGRKNYLFAGSHDGAQRIAMMYSFFGSCAANNVNPSKWLQDVLEKINDTKINNLDSLLPDQFRM